MWRPRPSTRRVTAVGCASAPCDHPCANARIVCHGLAKRRWLTCDTSTYAFQLPPHWQTKDVRVTTQLYYRRAFKPIADQRKWNVRAGGNPHGTDKDSSHVPPPPEVGDETFQLTNTTAYFNRLTLAGMDKFPAGFKDKDGYYFGLRATVNVIMYNTRSVAASEAPKTWKELLDPKWKGKEVTAHPGYSGVIATHVLALVNLIGWDYFKQLAQNQLIIVQSANDPPTVVAAGERAVAVNGGEYSFYQLKKKGNPVDMVYPKEGVPLVVSPTAITSFAPHPNAARLFTDFSFGRELQQFLADSEGL